MFLPVTIESASSLLPHVVFFTEEERLTSVLPNTSSQMPVGDIFEYFQGAASLLPAGKKILLVARPNKSLIMHGYVFDPDSLIFLTGLIAGDIWIFCDRREGE